MYYSERAILDLARAISASPETFRKKVFCFVRLKNGTAQDYPDCRIVVPPLITGAWGDEVVIFTTADHTSFIWRARPREGDDRETIGVRLHEAANV